jgi:glutamyl-tRNA synthetase/glutamyl-Q tRNA(Asp) synthetase
VESQELGLKGHELTEIGRYAPSTTGPAHPGTLLAALLCWLDVRSTSGRILLRLEDLDPERSKPGYRQAMIDDLAWLGLDWDARSLQSKREGAYHEALDRLAAQDLLYPCGCSRAQIREAGVRTPDGGFRYSGRCRERELPAPGRGGWRASSHPLRLRLPPGAIALTDLSGLDLGQDPLATFGDPIVLRRDGAVAYHLASVVDDAAGGVTRIVRGRDLMAHSATQVSLGHCLGYSTPSYRHHLLLLERRGTKLAKLHGSVGAPSLREHYTADQLCGVLAYAAGLIPGIEPTTPSELLTEFAWNRVHTRDRVAHWTGKHLEISPAPTSPD